MSSNALADSQAKLDHAFTKYCRLAMHFLNMSVAKVDILASEIGYPITNTVYLIIF